MTKDILLPNPSADLYQFSKPFPEPNEFFGSKDYHGYYVRGHALDFPYPAFGINSSDPVIYYQAQLVALVNKSWASKQGEALFNRDYGFGIILGGTQEEFKRIHGENQKAKELFILDKVSIRDTHYLKRYMAEGQAIIFVDLSMLPAKVEYSSSSPRSSRNIKWSYPFAATYFGHRQNLFQKDVIAWFSNLYDILCFDLDYQGIGKKKFFSQLRMSGETVETIMLAAKITQKHLKMLNDVKEQWSSYGDPLDGLKRGNINYSRMGL